MAKSKQIEVQAEVAGPRPSLDDLAKTKIKEIASDATKSVSYRIRELAGLGRKMGDIVRDLTEGGYKTKNGTAIRFQHVRNVLNTPAKKG